MSKKYYTIAVQYDVDGEPCDPPHHIEDRMVMMMQLMHEIGFGMDVSYGSVSYTHLKLPTIYSV